MTTRARPHRPTPRRPAPAARRRRGGPRPGIDSGATRAAIFHAAADAFSRRGFAGSSVDDIARIASVNKAMIYYHFADKLALYREIVRDMLRETGARIGEIADAADDTPQTKIARFIETFVGLTDARPYIPTLMMREIAEGAPHLDPDTLVLMRSVFVSFGRILDEGRQAGVFREVHPVLAYMTIVGPMLLNAARERAGSRPGRGDLPMFVQVSHAELTRHMQQVALRMLHKDSSS